MLLFKFVAQSCCEVGDENTFSVASSVSSWDTPATADPVGLTCGAITFDTEDASGAVLSTV